MGQRLGAGWGPELGRVLDRGLGVGWGPGLGRVQGPVQGGLRAQVLGRVHGVEVVQEGEVRGLEGMAQGVEAEEAEAAIALTVDK